MVIEIPDRHVQEAIGNLINTYNALCDYESITRIEYVTERFTIDDFIRQLKGVELPYSNEPSLKIGFEGNPCPDCGCEDGNHASDCQWIKGKGTWRKK